MKMTAEVFIEIAVHAASGAIHSARFTVSQELTYPAIFRAAHQNPDGSAPTLEQLGGDAVMFDHTQRLRAIEVEVTRRAAEDHSGADWTTQSVVGCARCGSDHAPLAFRRMAQPFAPPEAAPISWGWWATCPTSGDPILLAQRDKPGPD